MDQKAKESDELRRQALFSEKNSMAKSVELYLESIRVDSRNVLAYHNLAKLYLTEFNDLAKAEELCKRAYEVKDIPPEITSAPVWLDDIHEEVNADLDLLMMYIRIKQGNTNEARKYLNRIEAFYNKYSKGNYHTAKQIFEKHEQQVSAEASAYSSSGEPKGGCTSLVVLVVGCIVAVTLLVWH